jgi:hypothetical protein
MKPTRIFVPAILGLLSLMVANGVRAKIIAAIAGVE